VLAAVLAPAGRVATGQQDQTIEESPADESPDSPLAKYYGFAPMEVLKLVDGLLPPTIADVNGDGLGDIVVVNNRKARIDILLQKKDFRPSEDIPVEVVDEDVNDIFGREKTWRYERCSYDLDVQATALVIADLNGDGMKDVAFYAKDGLRVVLQTDGKAADDAAERASPAAADEAGKDEKDAGAPRQPQWLPPHKIDVTEGLASDRALAAGDLNADGRCDLAILGGDAVFTLLQKDDRSLARPEKFACGGARPRQIDIVDVNGDSRDDLVVLTGEQDFPVRVRYQTPAGKLGPEVRYELPEPAALEVFRLGKQPRCYFASVSRQSGRVRISLLAGAGNKAEYPVLTFPLEGGKDAGKRDAVAADVDGDGLKDVVVSDPAGAEFLLLKAAPAGLGTPKRFPGLTEMTRLAAGDLEGKGPESVVALSEKEKIIAVSRYANGRLTFPEAVSIAGEPHAMDLADVNGDGRYDLLYVSRDEESKKFHLRSIVALGRADQQAGPSIELTELKDKPLDIRVADIDHNDLADVMILRPYGPVLLVRQVASGKFEQETRADVHSGLVDDVQPERFSLAPLGEDGAPAALLVRKDYARSVVFDQDKGWSIVDQYPVSDPGTSLSVAAACTLDGSPSPAVVAYDSSRGRLVLMTRQDDGTYRPDREVKVGSVSARKVLFGKFGGRSPLCLLLCGAGELVLVPVSDETDLLVKVASHEPSIKNARFGVLTAGDLNGDGLDEVVAIDQARNHVEIIAFDDKGNMVPATKFKVFESPRETESSGYGGRREGGGEPRSAAVGDVTGDGRDDLVLLVHDRIIVYPQDPGRGEDKDKDRPGRLARP
jgi:hypothetical protein